MSSVPSEPPTPTPAPTPVCTHCGEAGHEAEHHGESCMRCGEVDHDRRTLWMACMYQMQELKVPLEEQVIYGRVGNKLGEERMPYGNVPAFESREDVESQEERARNFFTLRVCKECRGAWMGAIESWYLEGRKQRAVEVCSEHEDCRRNDLLAQECAAASRNIPVRVRGGIVMMTEAEYAKYRLERG